MESSTSLIAPVLKRKPIKKRKNFLDTKKSGEFIRFNRRQLGFTQGELAEQISVTRSHISNCEQGESRFAIEDYISIAEVFRKRATEKRMFHLQNIEWFDLVNGYRTSHPDVEAVKEKLSTALSELAESRAEVKRITEALLEALRKQP